MLFIEDLYHMIYIWQLFLCHLNKPKTNKIWTFQKQKKNVWHKLEENSKQVNFMFDKPIWPESKMYKTQRSFSLSKTLSEQYFRFSQNILGKKEKARFCQNKGRQLTSQTVTDSETVVDAGGGGLSRKPCCTGLKPRLFPSSHSWQKKELAG